MSAPLSRRIDRAVVDLEREKGRRSLSWFVRHAWPLLEPTTPYVHNWHIDIVSGALQALREGKIRKLIVNIPPGSMKSLHVSVFFNVWTWIVDPSERFLYTSFDGDLTFRDADKVRTVMASEWFLQRWGHRVRLSPHEGVGEFKTWVERDGRLVPCGGWRYSTSVDGKTTGWHPGIKVIDDPIKPKDANSDACEKTNHWWQSTFRSRGDPSTVRTCLIMQRLAENDLAGYFQDSENDWHVIKVPLEFVTDEPLRTPWGDDPRTVEGESFYKGRFPQGVIREIKDGTPDVAVYSAQYQQDPVPPGGIVFQPTWLEHTYDELPSDGYGLISLDCSFEGTEGSDRVALQYWWIAQCSFHLVDAIAERWTFTETCDAFESFCAKWHALGKLVEKKANGHAVIDTFARIIPGIVPVSPIGSKRARAVATTPLWRGGVVKLRAGAPWLHRYKSEHVKFPRAKNDDEVDCSSQLLAYAGGEAADEFGKAMANARELYRFGDAEPESPRRRRR